MDKLLARVLTTLSTLVEQHVNQCCWSSSSLQTAYTPRSMLLETSALSTSAIPLTSVLAASNLSITSVWMGEMRLKRATISILSRHHERKPYVKVPPSAEEPPDDASPRGREENFNYSHTVTHCMRTASETLQARHDSAKVPGRGTCENRGTSPCVPRSEALKACSP